MIQTQTPSTCEEAMNRAFSAHQIVKIEDMLRFAQSIIDYDSSENRTPIVLTKEKLENIVNQGDCLTECVVFKTSLEKSDNTFKECPQIFKSAERMDSNNQYFINSAKDDEIESTYSIALLKYIYENIKVKEIYFYKADLGTFSGKAKYGLHIMAQGVGLGIFNFSDIGPFFVISNKV